MNQNEKIANKSPKFVFFGTPDFALKILESLWDANFIPEFIITAPDAPKGKSHKSKPSPVKKMAENRGIPVSQPSSIKDLVSLQEKIKNLKPDIFIVASYGKIIPEELLRLPAKGALNIHPSLLPKYRGPSPIQAAILEGEKKTGVSIILLDEKMDHGPILAREKIAIQEKETYQSLHDKLADSGSKILLKTLRLWLGNKIKPREQNHSKATCTKILKREDGHIDWGQNALRIERMARAFQPWPGTFSFFEENDQQKRIYFLEAMAIEKNPNKNPGESFPFGKTFAIQAKNSALKIERVKMEGKNEMRAENFLNGHPCVKNLKFF